MQHRSAPKSEAENIFEVKQTGRDPAHHTVILPNPVRKKPPSNLTQYLNPRSNHEFRTAIRGLRNLRMV